MLSLLIPVALTFSTLAHGLFVVTTSPQCAQTCGNILDSTSGQEMTCSDSGYLSSIYGSTFKACLACEMNSTYYDAKTKLSDLHWAIYNLRFALSWCLFGFENNTATANTPCLTSFSCGPLQAAFEYDSLNPNASSYSYCPLIDSVSIPKCSSCLQEMGNENYLANFVTVLSAACIQQPVPGASLSLEGNIFSSQTVNITLPSSTPTSNFDPGTGGLTPGAKIGIAVGAILFVLGLAGFCTIWNGKRRRRRILAEKARASGYEWQARHGSVHYSSPHEVAGIGSSHGIGSQGQFFDSPQSQRPLITNAWGQIISDESPVSGHPGMNMSPEVGSSGTFEKAYFSPYSSTYTSPVSGGTGAKKVEQWSRDKKVEEESGGERIEMGAVPGGQQYPSDKKDPTSGASSGGWTAPQAPIISHPGYGRGGLTGEDAERGHAI